MGAQHLARLNICLWITQLLARWASPVILHYAREAPLEELTENIKENVRKQSLGTVEAKVSKDDKTLKEFTAGLDEHTTKLPQLEASLKKLAEKMDDRTNCQLKSPEYVLNPVSGVYHRIALMRGQPCFWYSQCGWEFGLTYHEAVSVPVDGHKDLCQRSFPSLRPGRKRTYKSRAEHSVG